MAGAADETSATRSRRVSVSAGCARPCPSCAACGPTSVAELDEVLAIRDVEAIVLGGGDATRWPPLGALLGAYRGHAGAPRVWLEAPAGSLSREVVEHLAAQGLFGAIVQLEAFGEAMERALGVVNGERVVADAERAGLRVEARVCVRPATFGIVVPLARKLAPRPVWLEIERRDWGKAAVTMSPDAIARTLLAAPNVRFSGQRRVDAGFAPPCVVPDAWAERPDAWDATLAPRGVSNRIWATCRECGLAERCAFGDAEAFREEDVRRARPIAESVPAASPLVVTTRRGGSRPEVLCTAAWTTMEVVDPKGDAHQCCATWTVGARGNLSGESLEDIWNGPGYREARRVMASGALEPLCRGICPRVHDRSLSEERLRIRPGAPAFVENQRLLLEDVAERREVMRAKPLYLALCPSTYCNYDCIMCLYGRTPRRDLRESIWSEVSALLPTLRGVTLLGGEPLAGPGVAEFLSDFDGARYPDCQIDLVTNGSLMTPSLLSRVDRCNFGDVTVSLNAGTPETYTRVQRGATLDEVLRNLDALLALRASRPRPFGVTVSFVVQPANADDMIAFGEIARSRDVRMRLLPLSVHGVEHLDYYGDADAVARIVRRLDELAAWARASRPVAVREIEATRSAIVEEAASRAAVASGEAAPPGARRLPLLA